MHFSSRSKLSIAVSLTALVALVGAFAIYSVVGKSVPHANAAASVTTFSGQLGTAKKTGTVNIGSLASPAHRSSGTRCLPDKHCMHPCPG